MFSKSFSDFIIAKDVTVSLCRFVEAIFLDFNARNEFPEGIIGGSGSPIDNKNIWNFIETVVLQKPEY